MQVANAEEVPINIVGGSTFGRYPKISLEKTYNMFVSDGWLVNYAGFQAERELAASGKGRAIFHSTRGNFFIAVVGSAVYRINLPNLSSSFIGNVGSLSQEVSIAENLSSQICIVDGQSAYIYHYTNGTFTKQTLTFGGNPIIPGAVRYHNTFFLIAPNPSSINPQNWYAFERATDSTIQVNAQFAIQTKSDTALAAVPLPGRGNNILVLGSIVGEIWTQIGSVNQAGVAVSYQRIQSSNIDYGTVSISTVASSDTYICWLGQNKDSAPSIMMTDGSQTQRISTDGIDFVLQSLHRPDRSTAIFYRQDGHLFYQLTFFDKRDNLSLLYDVDAKTFYHVSDEDLNFHPARQVVYSSMGTYFVSLNNAILYNMGSQYISYNHSLDDTVPGDIIPRIRIVKTVRKKSGERFRAGNFRFWLEQGVNEFFKLDGDNTEYCDGEVITEDVGDFMITESGLKILTEEGFCFPNIGPAVDLTLSKNGNQAFSNGVRRKINPQGYYRNEINWQQLGQANELTLQLRFWGLQRFVAADGVMEVY